MLSTGAFNALLKTLEEPPEHALFILATTETHKVPATIISRCQRFAFKRIPEGVITDRLRTICGGEGLDADAGALELLARIADGALRDALSLLEQCANITGGTITEASVRETLGLTGLTDLAAWLLEMDDLQKSMARLDAMYQSGLDISAILGQLSALLRDLLMGQMLEDLSVTRLPAEDAKALSAEWPRARILKALAQFADTRLSRGGDKKLEADLCMIRLACANEPEPVAVPAPAPVHAPAAPETLAPKQPQLRPDEPVPSELKPLPLDEEAMDNPFMQEAIRLMEERKNV